MPVSEAQKRSAQKWDKANMVTLSCRVSKEKALQFREACQVLETTVYQALQAAVDRTIAEAEEKSGR